MIFQIQTFVSNEIKVFLYDLELLGSELIICCLIGGSMFLTASAIDEGIGRFLFLLLDEDIIIALFCTQ